jgi:hypothetical protein
MPAAVELWVPAGAEGHVTATGEGSRVTWRGGPRRCKDDNPRSMRGDDAPAAEFPCLVFGGADPARTRGLLAPFSGCRRRACCGADPDSRVWPEPLAPNQIMFCPPKVKAVNHTDAFDALHRCRGVTGRCRRVARVAFSSRCSRSSPPRFPASPLLPGAAAGLAGAPRAHRLPARDAAGPMSWPQGAEGIARVIYEVMDCRP